MRTGKSRFLATVLFTLLLTILGSVQIYAAPKIVKLKRGVTYKYDFTGDGKAESFKYTQRQVYDDSYTGLYTYVNGKMQNLDYNQVAVYYYSFNRSNPFLVVNHHSGGYGTGIDVYRYSNGKLRDASGGYWIGTSNASYFNKISGNKFIVKARVRKPHQSMSFKQVKNSDLPYWIEQYSVNTNTHKMYRVTPYANMPGTQKYKYCGSSVLRTNSSPKKNDRKGVQIKYGTKVQFVQVYLKPVIKYYNGRKDSYICRIFKVKVNGRTGWFEESTNYPFTDS